MKEMLKRKPQNFGIDHGQFRWLVPWFIKLSLRTHKTGKAGQSGLGFMLYVYGFISLLIGINILSYRDPFTAFVITLTYSSVMVLFSVIMEFGAIVISPDDYLILGHLPVDEETFFAAKLANLGFFVLMVSLAMNSISTIFLAVKFSLAAMPLFFLVSLIANLFMTLLVVGFYCLAIRYFPLERVRDILTYVQLGLNFILIFGNQYLSRLASLSGNRSLEDFFWIKCLPSTWFAEMDLLILGSYRIDRLLLALLPIVGTIFLLRWTLARFSLSYAGYLQTLRESGRTVEKKPIAERVFVLFRQEPQEAAVAGLVLRYLARDREIRLRILPLFGVLIANGFVFFGKMPGGLTIGRGGGIYDLFPVVIIGWMLFMFLPSIGVNLTISEDWRASWAFWTTPVSGRAIARGVRHALTAVMYVPLFLLFLVILCFRYPVGEALLRVIPFILAGVAFISLTNTVFAAPPLSAERQTGKTTGITISWFFVGSIAAVAIGALEYFCFQNTIGTVGLLVGLVLGFWGALRLEERVLDKRMLKKEYEG